MKLDFWLPFFLKYFFLSSVYFSDTWGTFFERIVVDNKCKCARITSRIIPSAEDPSQDIVERNVRIMYVVFRASYFHFVSRYFLILVVVCM